MSFVSIQVVQSESSIDTATSWKKSRFILSERSDFRRIDDLSIVVKSFSVCMLTWQLMRYCCQGIWTALLIFVAYHFKQRSLLVVKNSWTLFRLRSRKTYASVMIPRSLILRKGRRQLFVHSFIVFCFYTALYNRRSIYAKSFVFHTWGEQFFCF